MSSQEPTAYVIERIRAAAAECAAHQLGIQVEGDDDHIVLRGCVDGEHSRQGVLGVARTLSAGRRVIDELECCGDEHLGAPEQL